MGFRSKATVQKSKSIALVTAPPTPQIFSPTGASLVTQGGQVVAGGVNAKPTGAQLVAQGGTVVYGGINARPTGASLVSQGGTLAWNYPLTLPSLVGWYTASQISGLNDSDPIGQWDDLSGSAHHLLQATGINQPLYKTSITNGRPAVLFDGSDDSMRALFTLAQPMSVAVSFVYVTETAGKHTVLDGGATANSMAIGNLSSTTTIALSGSAAISLTGVDKTTWGVCIGVCNGASSVLRFRGTETTGNIGTRSAGGLCVGMTLDTTGRANIYVGEIIVCSTNWDATTRASIDAYLGAWT